MARITFEDCLEHVENHFILVMIAAKRARQLTLGGKMPKIKNCKNKPAVIALREIAAGLISPEVLQDDYNQDNAMLLAGLDG